MTRTKALLVVGCIMLALAVLAALELKQEVTEPAGQAVTGLINKTEPPVQTLAETPKPGALVPLDQGTLRPEEAKPLPDAAQQAPQASQASQAPQAPQAPQAAPQIPAEVTMVAPPQTVTPPAGQHVVPVVGQKPTTAEQATPAQAAPEQTPAVAAQATPTVKPEAQKAEPAASEAKKPEQAAVKPEAVKPETRAESKPEKIEDKAVAKADDKADDKPEGSVRAIDTAGPVKVDKGQKAIVWTRLELADKTAVFRLSGAEKVEGKAFALPDPDRFVVDLAGDWAMRLPAVPKNAFIKKIRVGKYGDNTRMVLDLSGARNCQMVRINPTTLEFRIK